MNIIHFIRDGHVTSTFEGTKDRIVQFNLCHRCQFWVGLQHRSCGIAKVLESFQRHHAVETPVMECPKFQEFGVAGPDDLQPKNP